MNLIQIKDREREGYTDKKPDKDGLYLLVCEENNNKAEYIAVSGGATIMHSEMGKENLDYIHDNLICPMWKFIE